MVCLCVRDCVCVFSQTARILRQLATEFSCTLTRHKHIPQHTRRTRNRRVASGRAALASTFHNSQHGLTQHPKSAPVRVRRRRPAGHQNNGATHVRQHCRHRPNRNATAQQSTAAPLQHSRRQPQASTSQHKCGIHKPTKRITSGSVVVVVAVFRQCHRRSIAGNNLRTTKRIRNTAFLGAANRYAQLQPTEIPRERLSLSDEAITNPSRGGEPLDRSSGEIVNREKCCVCSVIT